MPKSKDIALRVADKDTALGRDAKSKEDRRATLEWCLNNNWAASDIGKIERSDTTNFHGWLMWPYEAP